jgi:hypothetical protein
VIDLERLYSTEALYRRRLAEERRQLGPHSTNLQHAKVMERSNALHRRIDAWHNVQRLYIPGVSVILARLEEAAPPGVLAEPPHEMRLFLPSEIDGEVPCSSKLMEYEWQLRFAQAHDALDELRNNLRLRSHVWKEKRRKAHGVAANTRALAVIAAQERKVEMSGCKYCVARKALSSLARYLNKDGWEIELPLLRKEDIRGYASGKEDESEGTRTLSWIWTATSAVAQAENDVGLHDGKYMLFLREPFI